LEKRTVFLRVLELLMRQSGGMLDMSRLAAESQVAGRRSRTGLVLNARIELEAAKPEFTFSLVGDPCDDLWRQCVARTSHAI
jgi:hypothetical protein